MTKYDIFINIANIENQRFVKLITIQQNNDNDATEKLIGAVNKIMQNVRIVLKKTSYNPEEDEVLSEDVPIALLPMTYWQYIEDKNLFAGPIRTTNGMEGIAIIKPQE